MPRLLKLVEAEIRHILSPVSRQPPAKAPQNTLAFRRLQSLTSALDIGPKCANQVRVVHESNY